MAVSSIPCVHSPQKISSSFAPRASEPSRRSRCSSIRLYSCHVLELVDDGKYTYTSAYVYTVNMHFELLQSCSSSIEKLNTVFNFAKRVVRRGMSVVPCVASNSKGGP